MSPLPEGLRRCGMPGPCCSRSLRWRWSGCGHRGGTARAHPHGGGAGAGLRRFGDSAFARSVAAVVLSVLAVFYGWIYVILPLFAWRRGRWPTEPIPLRRGSRTTQYGPKRAAARLQALRRPRLPPRLMHVRAEGSASAVIVLLVHPGARPWPPSSTSASASACTRHVAWPKRPRGAASAARVVVTDTHAGRTSFPRSPERCVLLFPDAPTGHSAASLRQGRAQGARAPSDERCIARWNAHMQRHDRFLVDDGYLSAEVDAGERRYTMKGGYLHHVAHAVAVELAPACAPAAQRAGRIARASGPGAA